MLETIWNMETQDPDDFLTLLFLLGHPQVQLRAIAVTPGSPEQLGFIQRATRDWFGRAIPLGAYTLAGAPNALSPWHYAAYGKASPSRDAEPAGAMLLSACSEETTFISGASLQNVGAAIKLAAKGGQALNIGHLVVQGGFAGEGIVAREKQLPQFAGQVTCPSHNLNGDPQTAISIQYQPGISLRHFVSKNVCHGVIYDAALHARVFEVKDHNLGLAYIWQGMHYFLQRKPSGKAIHDVLAACCAIDPTIGEWAEVEVYHERGNWGARLAPGSGTWIIIDYHRERFLQTFLAY